MKELAGRFVFYITDSVKEIIAIIWYFLSLLLLGLILALYINSVVLGEMSSSEFFKDFFGELKNYKNAEWFLSLQTVWERMIR